MSKVTFIEKQLLKFPAFMELSATALKVLLWFYLKRKLNNIGRRGKEDWIITNNGEIVFSYSEAEKKYGLTRSRFSRALSQLIELGFIDIAYHGGGMMGDCTLYSISNRWRLYGTDRFVFKTRPKDTRKLGFTDDNWEERTGKKKKSQSKPSNNFDTCSGNKIVTPNGSRKRTPSNKKDTEEISTKPLILKAMRLYADICGRSNKNITVL